MTLTAGYETRIEKHIAFIEGALNVDMCRAGDNGTCHLFFPNRKNKSGWDEDFLAFDSPDEMDNFLQNVVLLIKLGRMQKEG